MISGYIFYQHSAPNGTFSKKIRCVCPALTDEFVVLLKGITSYAQLLELAKQNNSRVGDENQFVKNQFKLYVCKTSKLNAMQMANLFWETELFEFSEPNLILLNAFR